jgi:uncharacterized MAPEG superfamily protein
MTIELTMLLYSTILAFVLVLIPASGAILANGAMTQAGPRDDLPEPSVFRKRANRLVSNMYENLLLFAIVVLIAFAAGVSNESTVLGAKIFFYARCVHAVIYLAGWPMIRPLFWAAGVVGMGMIACQLL